jgi:hypothetical protein
MPREESFKTNSGSYLSPQMRKSKQLKVLTNKEALGHKTVLEYMKQHLPLSLHLWAEFDGLPGPLSTQRLINTQKKFRILASINLQTFISYHA